MTPPTPDTPKTPCAACGGKGWVTPNIKMYPGDRVACSHCAPSAPEGRTLKNADTRQRVFDAAGRAYVEARATFPRQSGVYDQECGRALELAAAREALTIANERRMHAIGKGDVFNDGLLAELSTAVSHG